MCRAVIILDLPLIRYSLKLISVYDKFSCEYRVAYLTEKRSKVAPVLIPIVSSMN